MGLVLLSIVAFRLWYLQILAGDQFVASSLNNREREVIIEAPRGNIYDRNGVALVQNRAGLSVGLLAMDMPDPDSDEFYEEIYNLSEILDLPAARLLADYDKVVRTYVARTQRSLDHVRDFFDCVKSRRPTVANAEVMYNSMATVHAANICMWLGRNLKFDPVKEEFIDDPEANRLRARAMRAPWIA